MELCFRSIHIGCMTGVPVIDSLCRDIAAAYPSINAVLSKYSSLYSRVFAWDHGLQLVVALNRFTQDVFRIDIYDPGDPQNIQVLVTIIWFSRPIDIYRHSIIDTILTVGTRDNKEECLDLGYIPNNG